MPASFWHILLTLLLGLGILLCLFSYCGLQPHTGTGLLVFLLLSVFFFLASLQRKIMIGVSVLAVLAAGIWFLQFHGLQTLSDTFVAFMLRISSVPGALPLYASEASVLLAIGIYLLSYLSTSDDTGAFPAGSLILALLIMTWRSEKPIFLLYMLPSVICAIIMATQDDDHPWMNMRSILLLASVLAGLAFLFTPQNGIIIQPLKDTADHVRQRIMDYLFYTEPRTVFSLASEGYYPNGSSQLGGTAVPDDHLVMLVKTSSRVYLRGTAKNEYTGKTWIDTTGGRRYLWISPRWLSVRDSVFNQSLPSAELKNSPLLAPHSFSVQMATSSASDLFVPQRVLDLTCSGDIIPYFNQASEIFATRDLVSGDAWTVRASTAILGQQGLNELISLCGAQTDPDYEKICQDYTKLPSHLPNQLYELAHTIAADSPGNYEKVQALINYLKTHCRYSLEVDPVPDKVDFVSFFLLQTQEGYCTYFATALTLLCRMNGIPARYVEGFLVEPSSAGTSYVTGHEGHAWTEVYFPGFGWLTAEATPGQSGGQSSGASGNSSSSQPPSTIPPEMNSSNQNTPSPVPSVSPSPSPSPSPAPDAHSSPEPSASAPAPSPSESEDNPGNSSLLWLFLVLLLVLLAARTYLTLPSPKASRQKTTKDVWLVWMQEILDILHVMNQKRTATETHAAFFERLVANDPSIPDLRSLSDCASAVFYGHELPVDEDITLYRLTAQTLHSRLAWWQKIRLIVYRILPISRHL